MDKVENLREYLFYQTRKKQPVIQKADGIHLRDDSGKEYIDGSSGAVVCNIGYGNSRILEVIQQQSQSAFFAYRLHFDNEPALKLAEQLVLHSASHLNRIFYVSGGSEAVETAMKICRQYFYNRGEGSRAIFISRSPSYHGCKLSPYSSGWYTASTLHIMVPGFNPCFSMYSCSLS